MQNLGQFRTLQPSFFAGLLDDPVLYVNCRPTGRGILFDCGQLHHLAKRVFRSLDAVFISHAHMDHLGGFDHLVRHILVAPRTLQVFGPPGIAERIGHKLAGYDWNLAEEGWCNVAVHEVHPQHFEHVVFPGNRGFRARRRKKRPRPNRILYQTPYLSVEAELCEHRIPVLAFRVTEREAFLLDKQKMTAAGLSPGPWLKELKRRFHAGDWGTEPLTVWKMGGEGIIDERIADAGRLYRDIRRDAAPSSIGYLSDVGMSEDNLARIRGLLCEVSLLISECTFLRQDQEKARASAHLCTEDLNLICRELTPACLLPMHLSKSYAGDTQRLYAELAPPRQTRLLHLPNYLTPRPLLPCELPSPNGDG